jgi:hypothetical protein
VKILTSNSWIKAFSPPPPPVTNFVFGGEFLQLGDIFGNFWKNNAN